MKRLTEVVKIAREERLNESQSVEALWGLNLNNSEVFDLCMNEIGQGKFDPERIKEALSDKMIEDLPVVETWEDED